MPPPLVASSFARRAGAFMFVCDGGQGGSRQKAGYIREDVERPYDTISPPSECPEFRTKLRWQQVPQDNEEKKTRSRTRGVELAAQMSEVK